MICEWPEPQGSRTAGAYLFLRMFRLSKRVVKMKLTIIYENEGYSDLKSGWGFSCLVDVSGKKILFDTGSDGDALLFNMGKLGITIGEIDYLFISHDDWDHIGGLNTFLEARGSIPIFAPSSALPFLRKVVGDVELTGVGESQEIFSGCHTTGDLDGEQSLVVGTEKGNIVVCGCSHPGLEKILEEAREFGKVYGIMGGFHDLEKLEALNGLAFIGPCHCTKNKNEISNAFPENCKKCKTGSIFEF